MQIVLAVEQTSTGSDSPRATPKKTNPMRNRSNYWMMKYCLAAIAMPAGLASAAVVHQWTFNDGTFNDSVGSLNGTLDGAAAVSGGQMALTGGTGELDGSALALHTYTAVTLEFWATPDANQTGFRSLFGVGNDDVPASTAPPTEYFILQTHRGDDVTRASISLSTDASPWDEEDGANGAELNDGAEHHYVVTIAGTALTLYIDGALANTVTLGTAFAANSDGLSGLGSEFATIGAAYPADPIWGGLVNEFTIHDEALDDTGVLARFNAGPVPVPEPSTILLGSLGAFGLLRRRR